MLILYEAVLSLSFFLFLSFRVFFSFLKVKGASTINNFCDKITIIR